MITEAVLIMVSCTLFVQMGLSEAIQHLIHIHSQILSCPRCLTFWVSLGWFALHGYGLLPMVATAFIASYGALWLSLVYDALAIVYNYAYEQIAKTTDASEVTDSPVEHGKAGSDNDEVSKM